MSCFHPPTLAHHALVCTHTRTHTRTYTHACTHCTHTRSHNRLATEWAQRGLGSGPTAPNLYACEGYDSGLAVLQALNMTETDMGDINTKVCVRARVLVCCRVCGRSACVLKDGRVWDLNHV